MSKEGRTTSPGTRERLFPTAVHLRILSCDIPNQRIAQFQKSASKHQSSTEKDVSVRKLTLTLYDFALEYESMARPPVTHAVCALSAKGII